MGLLSRLDDFGEKDKRHGHRRIFGIDSFSGCFIKAGLDEVVTGGYWLKPFSDMQIETYYTNQMIDAFFYLGEKMPDIVGEICIIAKS
ncbi:hypothetical protein [Treponema primitia]|uniref:hypothetical protein n=1 Tax=Treponema primitia TaxID=88058 RepID=UPI000694A6A8|nr:hypothetical protein [Treponema primitia]